ncbi:helix-turn-helix domain-containing protein [Alteromonas halophila]|uniref:Transcriptional regulator n=1 Tax=Alteromonas halophila TaxID=516698 RepID=A0A918JKL8_9ALTE|nr:XRE family transcriptional regulator [Alteromonas halophila]GGW80546.1 transcriptional regulator [Alteromonas halophila]
MAVPQITEHIAAHLRAQRQARGWSLDTMARQSGVSKAMLGQIERQESSPTIATLWKIAAGLECSFSSFLAVPPTQERPDNEAFEHDPNMQIKTLFGFSATTQFEMFEITLSEHHEQRSPPHQTGVTEHLYVLQGQLSVLSDGQWQAVSQGASYLLAADSEHGYRDDSGLTRFISVIHYPLPDFP